MGSPSFYPFYLELWLDQFVHHLQKVQSPISNKLIIAMQHGEAETGEGLYVILVSIENHT